MEGRIDYLIELVEGLVERVDRLERLLLEVLGRRMKVVDGQLGRLRVLSVRDLSEDGLIVLEMFYEWARGRWRDWEVSYEEGRLEGYDRERGWVLLKKLTMQEFLDRALGLGYKRQGVLRVLGDLGILKYWERGRKRQYCIAVWITKPVRGARQVGGYYVLDFERMRVVAQELRELMAGRGGSEERQSEGERMGE